MHQSPLVVAQKDKGDLRLCVEICELNRSVIIDCHLLPLLENLFTNLAAATYYRQIHLISVYQLPLLSDCFGNTEYVFSLHKLFGLISASSAFQNMMTGVQNCLDLTVLCGNSMGNQNEYTNLLQSIKDVCVLQVLIILIMTILLIRINIGVKVLMFRFQFFSMGCCGVSLLTVPGFQPPSLGPVWAIDHLLPQITIFFCFY